MARALIVDDDEPIRSITEPDFRVHQTPFAIEQLISDVKAAAGAA